MAFSLSQEEKYTSSASVLFRDVSASVLASGMPEREAATNVELLSLGAIANRVERRLGGPGRAAEDVEVQQEGQSNVVAVKATDPDPRRAARTANAYASEYVRFRRELELGELRRRERFVQRELERIEQSGTDQSGIEQPGIEQSVTPDPRAAELRRELRRLEFETSGKSGVARVVSPAGVAREPSSPKPLQNTIVAGLVGLFLAGVLALIFERLDPRLKSPKEAAAILDRPILGIVHRSRGLARPVSNRVRSRDFDNFLALRTYLRYLGPNGDLKSVLVTSGTPGDGKTTVAWNLACAAAGPDRRVLLIEADVRAPTLAAALNVEPAGGLSDVLAGRAELADVMRDVAVESAQNGRTPPRIVSVVFAGRAQVGADPLDWERLGAALAEAEREFALIVVDTAPLVSVPDAVPLLAHVGGVIVIGRVGNTPRAALARLKEQLETVNAPTVGVVVNSVGREQHYGYGYGYEYSARVDAD